MAKLNSKKLIGLTPGSLFSFTGYRALKKKTAAVNINA